MENANVRLVSMEKITREKAAKKIYDAPSALMTWRAGMGLVTSQAGSAFALLDILVLLAERRKTFAQKRVVATVGVANPLPPATSVCVLSAHQTVHRARIMIAPSASQLVSPYNTQ